MGLFTSKKVVTATVAYNLAGDYVDRPNFLKSTVIAHNINNAPSIGDSLKDAYLAGPATRLKMFHRWARSQYGLIGVPDEDRVRIDNVVTQDIMSLVPEVEGQTPTIQSIEVGLPDYLYWAEQYMLENYPTEVESAWQADISEELDEITITRASGEVITFIPDNFQPSARYVYATYLYEPSGINGILIYKVGDGVAVVDDKVETTTYISNAFFPVIPVRLDNEFVSPDSDEQLYNIARKATKKSTGQSIDKLIEELKDNEDLDEIDYAYITFGVSLNTQEDIGKEYIFNFFKNLALDPGFSKSGYNEWQAESIFEENRYEEWRQEREAIASNNDNVPYPEVTDPDQLVGVPPQAAPSLSQRMLRVNPKGSKDINYDVRIVWTDLTIETGNGLGKAGAKAGDYWISNQQGYEYNAKAYGNNIDEKSSRYVNQLHLYRQIDSDNWERIRIDGLKQRTYVYRNHYEELDAVDVLLDIDESSFIIPLRYSVIADMDIKDSTQLALSSSYIVFHSYAIYKKRWYQTLLIIVIVIAITWATGGFGAAGAGALGTNIAIGTALGFTGTAAIVAGVLANYIAAMLINKILTAGASALLGDELGAVIGLIASVITINGLTNMAANGQFAVNFGSLSKATNIAKLTSTASDAYSSYLNASAKSTYKEMQELAKENEKRMAEVQKLYADLVGTDRGRIDPMMFVDGILDPYSTLIEQNNDQVFFETPEMFMKRTLLTGSDIAEMSIDMLYNFHDLTIVNDPSLSR